MPTKSRALKMKKKEKKHVRFSKYSEEQKTTGEFAVVSTKNNDGLTELSLAFECVILYYFNKSGFTNFQIFNLYQLKALSVMMDDLEERCSENDKTPVLNGGGCNEYIHRIHLEWLRRLHIMLNKAILEKEVVQTATKDVNGVNGVNEITM